LTTKTKCLSKSGRCFAHDFIYQIKEEKKWFNYDRKKEAIYLYNYASFFLHRHASVIDDRVSKKKRVRKSEEKESNG
jgi:hypothetical protein